MVKLVVETQIERGGRSYIYFSEPHPVAIDLDGDGIEEIVVVQNQVPGGWRWSSRARPAIGSSR